MKLHLGYILGLFAVSLAISAGYISVIGWGKLFAGEAMVVMIVMGIIEAAKVITTIYLHRYGKKKPRESGTSVLKHLLGGILTLKTYLVVGVIATMLLTSVGIYGFLTGAYQETANKMELQNGELSILEGKKSIYEEKIIENKGVIETKRERVAILSNLRKQQEVRIDSLQNKRYFTSARRVEAQIKEADTEIQKLNDDVDVIVELNSSLQDSVGSYQVKILVMASNSDIASEIGPLKYISTLTGFDMDSIINWLVLIIIFIFDPMAISLVLASNKVFDENSKKKDKTIVSNGNYNNIPKEPIDETILFDDEYQETYDIDLPINDESVSKLKRVGDKLKGKELFPKQINKAKKILDNIDDFNFPEEQLHDNKIKVNQLSDKKQEPVVTTGNVKREEIKEIKEGRGYSVDVPKPKKIGTNKEVREGEPNKFYFRRPNG